MSFFIFLLKTSIRSSISLKLSFLIETAFMIGNNGIFLVIWWLFFREFRDVGGWNFIDMVVLNIVVSGSYGISRVCFGGVKALSKSILNSGLDVFMTQPANVLLHVVGSKSQSKGWGQLLTSLILFLLNFKLLFWKSILLLFFIIGGAIVFTAFGVIVHSLPFWLGSIEDVSKKYADSLVLFVQYPVSIYSGGMQLVMYTLFPAAIIGYLPVEVIRSFSWINFLSFSGSVIIFTTVAFAVFYRGLNRYESGL